MTTTRTASHTDLDDAVTLTPTPEELEIITMPSPQPSPQPSPTRPPLLTQRTALLLLVAAALGGLVGALTFAATPVLATAVIAGLVTTGAVLLGGHQLIE